MRRSLFIPVALLAVLVVGFPVRAGAGTYTWKAELGSHEKYGTIRISAPYSGDDSTIAFCHEPH
jgi:hypothetical protein